MINLTLKEFNKVAKVLATAARLSEIKHMEGYVPSSILLRRKGLLKSELAKLTSAKEKEEKEETTVNLRIEIPEGTTTSKKEKSFAVNVKNLLKGKFNDVKVDDDEDILVVLKGLLPDNQSFGGGKIITEI